MLRRDFLAGAFAPRVDYRDYSRCLPDFLRGLAQEAYQRRNRALAALTTREAIAERQRWVRQVFWKLTGGEPERTPLNPRVTGRFERTAYRVENVVYESRPGFHIPANLYVPKSGKGPYPGVLFQMGHSKNGKAATVYQYCCQGLARLGFVVLAFDPMGQGERTYYPNPKTGLTRLASADDEHTVPGKQAILTGDTSTRLQTWDAVRSLDFLASLPIVDPNRLASTGNSGGGTLTMLLAAVDDRLACAAVACGNTENHSAEDFNSPGSTDDAEQNFIGAGPAGFDRWDTLYPLAPKPLLILASAKDFFGTYSPRYMSNGREEFEKLRRVYSVFGRGDHLGWYETPLPHGLSFDLRLEIYRWFVRWLKPEGAPAEVEEGSVKSEADETLFAASGNVVRMFGGRTPWSLARDRAREIRTPDSPADLPALLGIDSRTAANSFVKKGSTISKGLTIDAVEIESAPQVWVPSWIFRPPESKRTMVVLQPAGRNSRWGEDDLLQELARTGYSVCAPDIRGIGDSSPEYPRASARHAAWHQDEDSYAWASMMLGKPLLGQRVVDIVAVVRALGTNVIVAAAGKMTVPAIFAAAIEPAIGKVYVSGGLESFRSLVEAESYDHTFANFIFDMLHHTDLPQLRAHLGSKFAGGGAWNLQALSGL
jgi:cephalosporin-C deacetylase-like acetyl esterase